MMVYLLIIDISTGVNEFRITIIKGRDSYSGNCFNQTIMINVVGDRYY